jgi:hypothetical protein
LGENQREGIWKGFKGFIIIVYVIITCPKGVDNVAIFTCSNNRTSS